MNVIDANAYLGEWPFRDLRHKTAAQLLELMDSARIERALVSSLTAVFRQDVAECNEALLSAVSGCRERLAPLVTINPGYPEWQTDLAEAGEVCGIRLYPNYHGYEAADAAPVLEAAASLGLPVFVAVRLQDERQHHPACRVAQVAPEAILSMAGMVPAARITATMARLGEAERMLACETICVDISGIQGPAGCIERLVEKFGAKRLLFGSGIPLQYPLPNVMKLDMARISGLERELIRAGNAAHLVRG